MAKIMKDGKPSTSFSRQDREWVKSMGGSQPTGTITITENGEYDVATYATADVQVTGGGATIESIELTHVLPEGKSLQGFYYDVSLTEDFGSTMNCGGLDYLAYPFVSGNSTYIQMMDGETTAGDYMRASNIAVTGDIEADGEYITISGEGTITITWVIT